jgi:amino acid transporter
VYFSTTKFDKSKQENKMSAKSTLTKSIGTWQIMTAGVALVVAASTLVSDFTGYFTLGGAFAIALAVGFIVNLLLGMSAAELSVAYPKAGALYDYARAIFAGKTGEFLAVFLGLAFFGMFAFAASGEAAAGAYGLQALLGSDLPVNIFIIILTILAVIPNILGIKTTAWVSAALLLFMLGIRWFFGLAGFLGLSNTGTWSASNLSTETAVLKWFGEGGIMTAGLALAFWSFVGIEFACSLAEEVKEPRKSMPRGLILGLFGILLTSLIMGLGVTGTQPLDVWQEANAGTVGNGGDSPQRAVGQMMFGEIGYMLMALASVAATLGTLTIAYTTVPRIIYSIARDGRFFGPLSTAFGKLHPKFGTPVAATLFSMFVYIIPALYSNQVINWLYAAAYVWIVLYIVFHIFALVNRKVRPNSVKAFRGNWFIIVPAAGILLTAIALYFAFAGAHTQFGGGAIVVLLAAAMATVVSFALPARKASENLQSDVEIQQDYLMKIIETKRIATNEIMAINHKI